MCRCSATHSPPSRTLPSGVKERTGELLKDTKEAIHDATKPVQEKLAK
jgi:hypothetical protein